MRRVVSVAIVFALAAPASSAPVVLTVNPTLSSANVTLCLTITSTQCDSDVSPVAGTATVAVDCLANPTTLTLHDFDFILTQTIDLHLNYGTFVGQFNATATNVQLHYSTPGTPMPPVPIGPGGVISVPDVPVDATGQFNYTATILVCAAFTAALLPCSDTLDLSTFALNPVTLNGNVTVVGRTITLNGTVNTSGPIDPNNPSLGSISIDSMIVATGTAPLPSISTLVDVLTGQITAPDVVCDCDIDGNGSTDGRDIAAYVDAAI